MGSLEPTENSYDSSTGFSAFARIVHQLGVQHVHIIPQWLPINIVCGIGLHKATSLTFRADTNNQYGNPVKVQFEYPKRCPWPVGVFEHRNVSLSCYSVASKALFCQAWTLWAPWHFATSSPVSDGVTVTVYRRWRLCGGRGWLGC